MNTFGINNLPDMTDAYKLVQEKAKKDYDGDGKIESGSKEHAGAVHNACLLYTSPSPRNQA